MATLMRRAVFACLILAAALGCCTERGVEPKSPTEYRVYLGDGQPHLGLFYFAADDTSHRVIDSIPEFGQVEDMVVSPDGCYLYALRLLYLDDSTDYQLVKWNIVTKEIEGILPGHGFIRLVDGGKTLIRTLGGQFSLIETSTFTVREVRQVGAALPSTCERRSLIAGRVSSGPDSMLVVYDYAADTTVVIGVCRDLAGNAKLVAYLTIDPEGKYLYVTTYENGNSLVVIEIASWKTVAECPLVSSRGTAAIGPGGFPVFVPDPGTRDRTVGKIYALVPKTLSYITTITTEGCPYTEGVPRQLAEMQPSPDGKRMYAIGWQGHFWGSHVMIFDPRTYEKLGWLGAPRDHGGMPNAIAVGLAPSS